MCFSNSVFLSFLLLSLPLLADEVQRQTPDHTKLRPKEQTFLIGQINGEPIHLHFFPENQEPLKRKFKESRVINIEPGCIVIEAYTKQIDGSTMEIQILGDGWFTTQAMKTMGVDSNRVVVKHQPAKVKNQSGRILSIKPVRKADEKHSGGPSSSNRKDDPSSRTETNSRSK